VVLEELRDAGLRRGNGNGKGAGSSLPGGASEVGRVPATGC